MNYEIKDSGDRTEFKSGAVRDMKIGKGRCDLLPLDVIYCLNSDEGIEDKFYIYMNSFITEKNIDILIRLTNDFINSNFSTREEAFLELSKHFELGCNKYGENNWRKGIPIKSYIDSSIRHYIKYVNEEDDENHRVACLWNLVCCIWTFMNNKELKNDFCS